MENQKKNILFSLFIMPLGIFLVLMPYSLLIGWSLTSLVIFWFVIIPCLAVLIPRLILKKYHFTHPILGLLIFYTLMVWGIYDHWQSDYFLIMIVSLLVNILTVTLAVYVIGLNGKRTENVSL